MGEESVQSKFDSSKNSTSNDDSRSKGGLSIPGKTFNKQTFSRRSGSVRGNDDVKLIQKEDERLKINEDLLNFTMTGLLPRGMEIYSADPNPKPSLFND